MQRAVFALSGDRDLHFGPAHVNGDETVDVTIYDADGSAVLDLTGLALIGWPRAALHELAATRVPDGLWNPE